ncbi:MAG: transposase [Gemmatimonadota bacterium]
MPERTGCILSPHTPQVLDEYAAHYNAARPHRALELGRADGPIVRIAPHPGGRIIARPVLGGLHHEYEWQAA